MAEVLVVAAAVPELSGLPHDVRRAAIGVGDLEAACGLSSVLAIGTARAVLLVGTCGALVPDLELDQVVCVDFAVRPLKAPGIEVPEMIATGQGADGPLVDRIAGPLEARRVTCLSGRGMTISDGEAAMAAREHSAHVENLEVFAVLRACARAKVPVTAILAVAYRAGDHAREDLADHRSIAEAHAIATVARALAYV